MMPDEHGVGDTGADLDRAARNQMVAGLRIGSVIQGAAVLLFVFTAALRLDGCDFRDSMAGASFVAIGFDVVAALVALGWMSRSRHRGRAVVAGLALSFVPVLAAAAIMLAYVNSLSSGCPV